MATLTYAGTPGAGSESSTLLERGRDAAGDPTLGWKDHVWEHYGQAFLDCFGEARKDKSGRAKCEIEVRSK